MKRKPSVAAGQRWELESGETLRVLSVRGRGRNREAFVSRLRKSGWVPVSWIKGIGKLVK